MSSSRRLRPAVRVAAALEKVAAADRAAAAAALNDRERRVQEVTDAAATGWVEGPIALVGLITGARVTDIMTARAEQQAAEGRAEEAAATYMEAHRAHEMLSRLWSTRRQHELTAAETAVQREIDDVFSARAALRRTVA